MPLPTKYLTIILWLATTAAIAQSQPKPYHEQYRPQIHFSPKAHWMNDPNGLVYYKGIYHLFYQYYPKGTVWGPMHWGHATSTNLMNWTNKPIVLYPDSVGLIFSGSAVVDFANTSGFGKNGKPPLVAVFASHDMEKEKQGKPDPENESIAYSNDDGTTWTKYADNPVLRSPGIKDFRDPKVMWYEAAKKWVMTLATKDRVTFYSSPNLKKWTKESEFGEHLGAHGGVWECPDLFPLTNADGKMLWVLLVSINPGGFNGGSATQYFIGNFDGIKFTPNNTDTRWLDYGTDNYAGVTYSNTGNRRIFIGWMSNWQYATTVPTTTWRSTMTIPRELKLEKVDTSYFVAAEPVNELDKLKSISTEKTSLVINGDLNLTKTLKISGDKYQLKLSTKQLKSFAITLSNRMNEKLIVGYDEAQKSWYIDRTQAGKADFANDFAKRFTAPRIAKNKGGDITLIVDAASVELFADNGLSVMTAIFFPTKPFDNAAINAKDFYIDKLQYSRLKSIWK